VKDSWAAFMFYKVAKVCILLQDMPTNISLCKHTYDIFVIYLFIYLWFMIYFYDHLLIPTRIFLEKECRSYANSEDLGTIRKTDTFRI
jgi:hypothetical protein